jgi:hypothetical protein
MIAPAGAPTNPYFEDKSNIEKSKPPPIAPIQEKNSLYTTADLESAR